jgi:hydrogenase nickel incorporation protein HypA/HybF
MRELSWCATLLRRIERECQGGGAVRIAAIRLRIGECAGVDPRRFSGVFQALARGTIAQGAVLRIERVALEGHCERCASRFAVVDYRFACPCCGSARTRVVAGDEIVLESLTIVHECDPSLGGLH